MKTKKKAEGSKEKKQSGGVLEKVTGILDDVLNAKIFDMESDDDAPRSEEAEEPAESDDDSDDDDDEPKPRGEAAPAPKPEFTFKHIFRGLPGTGTKPDPAPETEPPQDEDK